jgi:hypothetical protein
VKTKLALKVNKASYKIEINSYDKKKKHHQKKQVPLVLSISTFHHTALPYFNANQ